MSRSVKLATKAIENNKLISFLTGRDGYEIPLNRYVPAFFPTDFELVLRVGLYGYYIEKKDEGLPARITEALEQLLNGDCVDVWCVFIICSYQMPFEIRGKSPFSIMSDEFISKLKASLQEHKAELEQCHLWQGKSHDKGLWEDIEFTNNYLIREYSVNWL